MEPVTTAAATAAGSGLLDDLLAGLMKPEPLAAGVGVGGELLSGFLNDDPVRSKQQKYQNYGTSFNLPVAGPSSVLQGGKDISDMLTLRRRQQLYNKAMRELSQIKPGRMQPGQVSAFTSGQNPDLKFPEYPDMPFPRGRIPTSKPGLGALGGSLMWNAMPQVWNMSA